MTTKLAVPPAPPTELVVATTIPETWQAAFIHMTDRFMKVIGKQAGLIKDLTTGLEDARGLIAAGDRQRADMLAKLDGLQAALDVHDKAVKALAETTAPRGTVDEVAVRLDSFSSTLDAHGKTISELLTAGEAAQERITAVEAAATAIDQRVTADGEAIATIRDGWTAVEDAASATARRISDLDATVVDLFTGVGERFDRAGAEIGQAIEAVASNLEVVRVFSEQVEDRANKRLDALDPRLVEIADVLTATGERLAVLDQHGKDLAAVGERVAAAGARIEALSEGVDAAGKAVEIVAAGLDQEGKARAAAVAAVARSVDELSEIASGEDGALSDRINAVATRVETVESGAKLVDEAVGIINGTVKLIDDAVAAVRREVQANALAIDDDRARLGKVEDGVAAFIRITAEAGAEIKTFDVRLTQIESSATDACRRVTIALGEMPAAMMINKAGHLVRVSRSGDEVDLGCVAVDGKDAADIVSARVEKGRLVFTRSDRTEFGCELPIVEPAAPPPTPSPDIDPTALGYLSKDPNVRALQVDDMRKMRAAKKTYEKIAEKYQTSARHVVRLLKGDSA